MSAGGISYDCLTTSRKVTLPSVESWGTNMNIVKDPNKGIFTRRKDKVGDTQEILLAQDESGDRISECINVYARGVNPMVSVSYDNYGNNGGGGSRSYFGKQAVSLPYKPEVFIPPIQRQEDLLPLSRMPRNWFYAFTNPELPNVIQKMSCPEERSAIESKKLDYTIDTNKQYIKELPQIVSETQPQVHDKIMNIQTNSTKSNQHQGQFHDKMEKNISKINQNKKIYEAFTNSSAPYKKYSIPNTDIQRSIHQNLLHQIVNTNKCENRQQTIQHDTLNRDVSTTPIPGLPYHTKKTRNIELSPFLTTNKENSSGTHENVLNVCAKTSKGVDGKGIHHYEETNPSNAIEKNLLSIDQLKTSNKSDSTSLKYFPQFIDNDKVSRNVKDVFIIDQETSKGTNSRTVDVNIHDNTPYQAQNGHIYIDVDSAKGSSSIEKFNTIEAYTAKNINNDMLKYNIKSNKTINQQRIFIDPSNIHTKQTICVPVDTPKTRDIYKNVTPIDLSTIQRKNNVSVSHEGSKTFIDQDKWIGERPERAARVLTSNVDFGSNQTDTKEDFYNIQGTNRSDIEQRQIHVGSFDPKPQGISRTREELDMNHSSTIEHRYNSLQKGVQDQFNQRYMV
jgi:hypothetical protein